MLAVIGGTGLAKFTGLAITHRQVIRTPYGEPSGALTFGNLKGRLVVFLARHGYGHTIAPHEVNYRANLWALSSQQVKEVISVASVGGIRADLTPGALVLPSQIIDYTHSRKATFFEGSDQAVTHTDFTLPYTRALQERCLSAASQAGESLLFGGVYAAVQGPRLETAAEINRIERDGADMVGMTGMPEAILARELNMRYAAIAVVANYAAGRGPSKEAVALEDIHAVLQTSMQKVKNILEHLVAIDD
ncbi:MAG: S-methyl-5'-thioinosine phosphorylase [Burkholderiales bacterium]